MLWLYDRRKTNRTRLLIAKSLPGEERVPFLQLLTRELRLEPHKYGQQFSRYCPDLRLRVADVQISHEGKLLGGIEDQGGWLSLQGFAAAKRYVSATATFDRYPVNLVTEARQIESLGGMRVQFAMSNDVTNELIGGWVTNPEYVEDQLLSEGCESGSSVLRARDLEMDTQRPPWVPAAIVLRVRRAKQSESKGSLSSRS